MHARALPAARALRRASRADQRALPPRRLRDERGGAPDRRGARREGGADPLPAPAAAAAAMGGAARFAERLHAFLEALPKRAAVRDRAAQPELLDARLRGRAARRRRGALRERASDDAVGRPPGGARRRRRRTRGRRALDARPRPGLRRRRRTLPAVRSPGRPRRRHARRDRRPLPAGGGDAPAYVIVNNKAEGSAPESIRRLAEALSAT